MKEAVAADTITALATPPGRGALAVVRVSGPQARRVLSSIAPSWKGTERPREPILTRLVDPVDKRLLDRALVTLWPGPGSYTGEDLVEISTHGGVLVPALVLAALERAGARPAEAGEFTRRAYLNGKLDLVQAEAVRDLVDAGSEASHQAAVHQMEGGLSRRLGEMREGLIGLEALLVHHLDFPEEDDPPIPVSEVIDAAERLAEGLRELLQTAPEGELLREGALVVLAGRPNSGKSSLFNALLGVERAIVTARPGTTRDALEAAVSFEGYPFRLVDTAGLRDEAEEVERLGIEVARRYLKHAEVVLLCVSAELGWGAAEDGFLQEVAGTTPVVLLRTKADLSHDTATLGGSAAGGAPRPLAGLAPRAIRLCAELDVSVVDRRGLGALQRVLRDLVFQGLAGGGGLAEPLLTRKRQADGVRIALGEVEAFVEALGAGVPAEMAATHLRPAETALEELLGVISPDEILDRLFADFCIGK